MAVPMLQIIAFLTVMEMPRFIMKSIVGLQHDNQKCPFGISGNESVNAVNWYQNALHVNIAGVVNPQPTHSADFTTFSTTHTDPIPVERFTLSSTPNIPYVDRVNLNSDTWLVHYPTYFTVEFYSSGSWAGAGFVKDNQPNATDTNTTVGEHIHKSAPVKAHKRLNW